jgi:hypothetical protein
LVTLLPEEGIEKNREGGDCDGMVSGCAGFKQVERAKLAVKGLLGEIDEICTPSRK